MKILFLYHGCYAVPLLYTFYVICVLSRGCLITGVKFKLFVIGYPRGSLVNYARFKVIIKVIPGNCIPLPCVPTAHDFRVIRARK